MHPTRAALAFLLCGTTLAAEDTPEFKPRRVVKPFPAIKDAPFIEASAVRAQVRDADLVIGVEIGGKARAYPINMLTGPTREIINDTVGGRAIAATW